MFRLFGGHEPGKKPIMPHYVNVASGRFFGRDFCWVCWLAVDAIGFAVAWTAGVMAYKNHDKKN
jgi:hypothetical protein